MKPTTTFVIVGGVLVIVIIFILSLFGVLALPFDLGLTSDSAQEEPPGTTDCSYTEMEILDMLKLLSGKNLNNQQGLSYVRALNMEVCGQNDQSPEQIAQFYRAENSDWYLYSETTDTGSGWRAYTLVWINDQTAPTLARAIITGSGTTVQSTYGYNTMTLTSDGTSITYFAFANWVASS